MCNQIDDTQNLKKQIKLLHDELAISKKRYELAIINSNVLAFDYLIDEKKIKAHSSSKALNLFLFDVEDVMNPDSWNGLVCQKDIKKIILMFDAINNGCKHICELINFEINEVLYLTEVAMTILPIKNKSKSAIVVVSDMTDQNMLENERTFSEVFTQEMVHRFEANVSRNVVSFPDKEWLKHLNVRAYKSYNRFITEMASKTVHPDDKETYLLYSTAKNIIKFHAENRINFSFEYRCLHKHTGEYIWVNKRTVILEDSLTKEIKIRCFIQNITEDKKKENDLKNNFLLDELFLKSMIVYYVNFTKNQFAKGHEEWKKLYNIDPKSNYNQMIKKFKDEVVFPEDKEAYLKAFELNNILEAYKSGDSEVTCEYRRPNRDGEFIWVTAHIKIFMDGFSNDIRGVIFIENIHEKKTKEIELLYKSQHDALSGLLNKDAVEREIDKFLEEDGKNGKHAFFIFDIDNFKDINDNFGHAFGDVVISKLAKQVKKLFLEKDILGRIGGDEFVGLMKDIPNNLYAITKAKALCSQLQEVYVQSGHEYKVTISIGIAIYDIHGKNYQELYTRSDSALYKSKNNGKNRFFIYHDGLAMRTKEVNFSGIKRYIKDLNFDANIEACIFRILYTAEDKQKAILAVLELVGKHYEVDRVFIMEKAIKNDLSVTFEWVSNEKHHLNDNLNSFNIDTNELKNLFKNGVYFIHNFSEFKDRASKELQNLEIKSALMLTLEKNNELTGVIGFEEYKCNRYPSQKEISELRTIADILSVFIREIRAGAENERNRKICCGMVNKFDVVGALIDPDTQILEFMNEKTKKMFPNAKLGEVYYDGFWYQKLSNDSSLMEMLTNVAKDEKVEAEIVDNQTRKKLKVAALWLEWHDGKQKCFFNATEII